MLHLIGQSALSAFRVDKVQALISAEQLPGQLVGTHFHYLVDHGASLTDQDVARLETLLIATSRQRAWRRDSEMARNPAFWHAIALEFKGNRYCTTLWIVGSA